MAKNKKTLSRKTSSALWIWLIGGAVLLFLVAALVWFASANAVPRAMPNTNTIGGANANANTADIAANLANSQNAFNVGTRVGKNAPAFTLPDADGKPYTFQPGDGKKYVFAFNMGYS